MKKSQKSSTTALKVPSVRSGNLSDAEPERWEKLKEKVSKCLHHLIEFCIVIEEIKREGLWRAEFDTWEDFCDRFLNMSRSYVFRYLQAGKIVRELLPIGNILPANEFQVRPLKRLRNPEHRRQAWKQIVDNAGDQPITNEIIEAVVAKFEADIKPPIEGHSGSEEVSVTGISESKVQPQPEEETFELADRSCSDPIPWSGYVASADQVRAKLKAMQEKNERAPARVRKNKGVIARRQSLVIQIAHAINDIAGADPDGETRGSLYWAIYEIHHLTASLRPCEGEVATDGGVPGDARQGEKVAA